MKAGQSGTTGAGGAGGLDGLASCDSLGGSSGVGVGGLYTVGDDGRPPRETFTRPVTVVSVDDCTTGVCGSTVSGRRLIVSEAGGRRWTMYMTFLALAPDFVSAGEVLDLRVVFRQASTAVGASYEFVSTILSRAGTPVVFGVTDDADLLDYGITVASSGYRCKSNCYTTSGTIVTYGGEMRTVPPGGVHFGKLWFDGSYRDLLRGPCDTLFHFEDMSGFTDR